MTGDELRALLTMAAPSRKHPANSESGFTAAERAMAKSARLLAPRRSVPHHWDTIITLDLMGWTGGEIADHMRMSLNRVSVVRRTERYMAEKAKRLGTLDKEFESLKPLAILALRQGLRSQDENAALRASEQWFKTAGYGSHGTRQDESQGLTAEAVAAAIVKQSVQVNINISRDEIATLGIEE